MWRGVEASNPRMGRERKRGEVVHIRAAGAAWREEGEKTRTRPLLCRSPGIMERGGREGEVGNEESDASSGQEFTK